MDQLDDAIDCGGEYFSGCKQHQLYWYRSEDEVGRPLLFIHSVNAAPSAIELKPLFKHFQLSRPVFAPDYQVSGARNAIWESSHRRTLRARLRQ